MSEQVQQEGEFKLKAKKTTPRKLVKNDQPIKVDLTMPKEQGEPIKVVIPKEQTNAVQEQDPAESVLRAEQPEVELQEVGQGNKGSTENVIEEINQQEVVQEAANLEQELNKQVQEQTNTGKKLPENIEKLISFMEDTGGTVEDYVRLNTDYSNVDSNALLKEYYKNTRPHLDSEEIDFLIEDNFDYDEDLDDERDVRKKRLAFKEEVAKAQNHLEQVKSKYYDEIKLRPGVTQDQQKAMDFFNRYNKQQESAEAQHFKFKDETKKLFAQEFKGFEFNLGEKSFRYGVANQEALAEKQSDISNLIKKFLNKDGDVVDVKGYHKAIYAAENADTIAKHFYEQGKADAIKEVVAKSNNITNAPRTAPNGDGFINGFKVKAINGVDSSKLRIQTKKF
tara:strand:- start:333 stop:1514 length:1182 start_codon:yes stop_codon:yes gene_type:complete